MRVIDILTRATGGADGPKDWPLQCVEHDGEIPLAPGATRMTVEEYNRWLAANAATWEAWRAANPPPPPPPEPLPPLSGSRFRIAMLYAGITAVQVHAAIDKIADPTEREIARIMFEHSHEFERSHPLVNQLGAAFGLTPAQIDTIWRKAAET